MSDQSDANGVKKRRGRPKVHPHAGAENRRVTVILPKELNDYYVALALATKASLNATIVLALKEFAGPVQKYKTMMSSLARVIKSNEALESRNVLLLEIQSQFILEYLSNTPLPGDAQIRKEMLQHGMARHKTFFDKVRASMQTNQKTALATLMDAYLTEGES